ncbi:nucleotidyltransferase family protein [Gorillibacterium sp. CAU 1737]|uniref:nucleotidyltransferase family protein n=1 Tax=Gorillibacterium sp. CAU 1737 TaxID=3140362 RepID=UPI0032614160
MKLNSVEDILSLVQEDEWMMEVLRAAQLLRLPDWWISAGFVRAKVWDTLHGFAERTPLPDVDVVYFDRSQLENAEAVEKELEQKLRGLNGTVPWSVKNEARMHEVNDLPPFGSTVEAISHFTETATALGLTLDEEGRPILAAPWGIEDLLRLEVRPTPLYRENEEYQAIYNRRIMKKKWKNSWPQLQIYSATGELLEEESFQ